MDLADYILVHTTASPEPAADSQDVFFFHVRLNGQPSGAELQAALRAGETVELLDGHEHSYLELGAWLGSQEIALRLMGMGAALGLWQLLTPTTVLGTLVSREQAAQLAGAGYITLKARPKDAAYSLH